MIDPEDQKMSWPYAFTIVGVVFCLTLPSIIYGVASVFAGK